MSSTLFDNPETKMPSTELATVEVTPMTLISDAIHAGVPVDVVRELVELQRGIAADIAKKDFAVAMVECQREMPVVVHDAKNKGTDSTYSTLETIQKQTKPIYSRFGFSMSFGEGDCTIPNFKRTTCDVTHEGGHMRSYHLDLPIDGAGAKGGATSMNAVQGCISTTSYGQRRLCCMIWNITIAGEDDDAQALSCIDEQQIAMLNEWIETSGADRVRFLAAYEIKSLSQMPVKVFDTALQTLKRKHAQRK